MDIKTIRKDFPIFDVYKDLIYFDNAATTQRPKVVIDALKEFYERYNANIHRGIYKLSEEATNLYEKSKEITKEFINANSTEEVIFTRNTTESINLVAYSYGIKNIKRGDNIVLSVMEHHSNLVPWQIISNMRGVELRFVNMNEEYEIDIEDLKNKIDNKTKLVSVVHVSNALGSVNPIKDIVEIAHDKDIPVLIDGAQSVPHIEVDVKDLDVDFLAFSSHKMLGPFGVGVLYGKENLLEQMNPFLGGGDMIKACSLKECSYNVLPYKFEAGTPNIADAYAFSNAIEYLMKIGMKNIEHHEISLTKYALKELLDLPFIEVYGKKDVNKRGGIISFNVKGLHSHDVATILDESNIAVRAGHHCAMPLMKILGVNSTVRASFYLYNTKEEVAQFVNVLKGIGNVI